MVSVVAAGFDFSGLERAVSVVRIAWLAANHANPGAKAFCRDGRATEQAAAAGGRDTNRYRLNTPSSSSAAVPCPAITRASL